MVTKIKNNKLSSKNVIDMKKVNKTKIETSNNTDKKSYSKTLILDGLCCANCAAKIEREVNRIKTVENASINFLAKKLKVFYDDNNNENEVIEKIKNIVSKIEPDVKVVIYDENTARQREEHHHHHESTDDNKKDLIKIIIGIVIFAVAGIFKFSFWIDFSLYFAAYIIVGGEVVLRAVKNIAKGQVFDENFLMAIATIGAFSIKQFPEGVAVMLFYQVGELFQSIAVNRSRKSISSLMDIRPDFANIKENNIIKKVSPEDVQVGDIIIIKPGEKVPLDGSIVEGQSVIDTSALTGEAIPREVTIGDSILSGCINKSGVLNVKVTKTFGESTVSKILDLVQNASSKKAPTENFITKFARFYTPIVVISALALAFIPPMFINGATFSEWIYRALVFLVVSCPCALVISIPLGFFGGIGGASKNGILIKGGNYLEALNSVDIVVFDKTGTLTKGTFKVSKIFNEHGFNEENILEFAAFAESYSNHPIANSIVKAYRKEIDKSYIENYKEISGHGISANIKGKSILVGNDKLMRENNIQYKDVDYVGTILYLAVDKQYAGCIVISDEVKEDSEKAIKSLKNMGIKRTVMLTGDKKEVGNKIGKDLGIDEVYTELLPNEKVEKIEMLNNMKASNKKLIFVGDGINDAPVLARADIGIAMGGVGSDAAIEAADVVIMTDEPSKIVTAIKIAKKTKGIVMQNIIFALGVKGIILILGAIGVATMWEAVFGDVGVAVIAILNSMRAIKMERF